MPSNVAQFFRKTFASLALHEEGWMPDFRTLYFSFLCVSRVHTMPFYKDQILL